MTGVLVVGRRLFDLIFFDQLTNAPITLDGPLSLVEGKGRHPPRYRVVYS
jgi:hypothetical protein